MFRRQADLQKLYEPLTRTVIHAVKARDVATFVGKWLRVDSELDMGNRYDVRIEDTPDPAHHGTTRLNQTALWATALTAGQVSRTLKNLRLRGLIKKVGRTYKYYFTPIGKQVIATGLYLKSLRVVPMLSAA